VHANADDFKTDPPATREPHRLRVLVKPPGR